MGSQIDFEQHIPSLTRFAISLTRNRDTANDLVQDTVMRMLTRDNDAEQIDNVKSFMMSTLKRLFIDGTRRDKRFDKSVDVDDMDMISHEAPQGLKMTAKEVMSALARLPVEVTAPLLAHARDNKTYAEISEEEGVPIGTIMSRISRARAALKQKICRGDKDCMESKDFGSHEFSEAGL